MLIRFLGFEVDLGPCVVRIPCRCKDCQHQIKSWVKDGRRKGGGYWQHSCQENECMGEDSQFCSLGKRKE